MLFSFFWEIIWSAFRYDEQELGTWKGEHLKPGKLAKKYGVPRSTLRKRIIGEVEGFKHASGGKGKSRVFESKAEG